MRRATTLLFVASMLALAASPPARANGDPASTLVRRGVDLRREERNEEALAAFTEAYRISPKPSIGAQLGLAEQALGHWIAAERYLDGALASGDEPWIAKNLASLEQARDVVRQHLGWVSVDVEIAEAQLELDGAPLARGIETRALAGARAVQASADGYIPDVRIVTVNPGEHVHVAVTLRPLVAAPPAPQVGAPAVVAELPRAPAAPMAIDRAHVSRAPWGPVALGGLGVVALVGGAYAGIRTMQDKSDEAAAVKRSDDARARAAYADGRDASVISTVAFTAGAAAVVGGALWWLLARPQSHDSRQIHAIPLVGARAGGLAVSGAW